jgi:cobalamin biosynthesis protein CobT
MCLMPWSALTRYLLGFLLQNRPETSHGHDSHHDSHGNDHEEKEEEPKDDEDSSEDKPEEPTSEESNDTENAKASENSDDSDSSDEGEEADTPDSSEDESDGVEKKDGNTKKIIPDAKGGKKLRLESDQGTQMGKIDEQVFDIMKFPFIPTLILDRVQQQVSTVVLRKVYPTQTQSILPTLAKTQTRAKRERGLLRQRNRRILLTPPDHRLSSDLLTA